MAFILNMCCDDPLHCTCRHDDGRDVDALKSRSTAGLAAGDELDDVDYPSRSPASYGLNSLPGQAWLFANVRADPEPNGPLTRPPLFDLLAKRQRQGLEL